MNRQRLLSDALLESERSSITFLDENETETVPRAQLRDQAAEVASRIKTLVPPGSTVFLIGRTSRELVTALQAVWMAGGLPSIASTPLRLQSKTGFMRQLQRLMAVARPSLVFHDESLGSLLAQVSAIAAVQPLRVPLTDVGLRHIPKASTASESQAVARTGPALLQFTSGSTGSPRGVVISHTALAANLQGMASAFRVGVGDCVVSWLPLFHDMGLVAAFALALYADANLALGTPESFVRTPREWVQQLEQFQATHTFAPNFAYELAARALSKGTEGYDLTPLRHAVNGGEPINPDGFEALASHPSLHNLSPAALTCAYGMAETTVATTLAVGEGVRGDAVDPEALGLQGLARASCGRARRFAIVGKPVGGLAVRLVSPEGNRAVHERVVGEIEVRGASLMDGYFVNDRIDQAVTPDGWFQTGDLGYFVGPELVVCGRAKDIVIVAGRNYFPEDIERAAWRVDGVRTGNVIAFGISSDAGAGHRERLILVAEVRARTAGLIDRVAEAVREEVGLRPDDIVLVEPGSLPKTTSGKRQRSACRRKYLAGDLT